MAFVGLNFTKISGERTGSKVSNTKAKRDMKITNISKEKLPVGDEDSTLKFDFSFEIEYIDLGRLYLEGFTLYLSSPEETNGILTKWKDKNKVDPKLMAAVLNNVLFSCHIKALNLSQDLSLPPHIGLPYVSVDSEKKEKKK